MSERIITFGEATREAMLEEMRADERVFVYGEDMPSGSLAAARYSIKNVSSQPAFLHNRNGRSGKGSIDSLV